MNIVEAHYSWLPQIIDVDKADPLTGLVSWMKIETKQKTLDEVVPCVVGGREYQFVDPTPPPMKRVKLTSSVHQTNCCHLSC